MSKLYVLYKYPDYQEFEEEEWFQKEAHLAEAEKAGPAAYFIPYDRTISKEPDTDITEEELEVLVTKRGLSIMNLLDFVIKYNGIIGVGLISLGKDLKDYCRSKIISNMSYEE